jgi:CBS domain containing-hemolysin-like protein
MTYSIDGLLLIDVVNDYFGFEIDTADYDTIGGWVYAQLIKSPMKGQSVFYNDEYEFVIEETDYMHISRVTLTRFDLPGGIPLDYTCRCRKS